jgi:hypothetical protein
MKSRQNDAVLPTQKKMARSTPQRNRDLMSKWEKNIAFCEGKDDARTPLCSRTPTFDAGDPKSDKKTRVLPSEKKGTHATPQRNCPFCQVRHKMHAFY